jgi:N-acetylmuramoyl-L-alanine amidase
MHGTGLARRLRVSPNVELRGHGKPADTLILHYTGMKDAELACDWLCRHESKVSCHYLIDERGDITQMVDEDLRAWHAGVSSWAGEADMNSRSIGIEIHNPGHAAGYPAFPLVQMEAVAALSRDIVQRLSIAPRRVLAHSDVAPRRKIDPGEKFDWAYLAAQGVGHWRPPVAVREGPVLKIGDTGEDVRQLQSRLKDYGYGVNTDGSYDEQTKLVVAAFQRHFRPARVDGMADVSTIETLRGLG